MKLSFVIPVFNTEAYVRRCIESAFAQDLNEADFELICVNDGSTDNSGQILHELASTYSNIVIIETPNGGAVARQEHRN